MIENMKMAEIRHRAMNTVHTFHTGRLPQS